MDRGKGLSVRSGSGIQIDFMYRGRRCRETLRLDPSKANLQFAARKRQAILYEIQHGSFDYSKHFPNSPKARSLSGRPIQTIAHALDDFLRSAKARCAASTLRDYTSAIEYHLKPAFGDRLLSEITTTEIRTWMASLAISPKRINNVLVPLRGVLGDAFADELIDRNPAARIRNLPHRPEEPDPLEPAEVAKLLDACDIQTRNLFQFAIWTGLRTSELIALEWGDIDRNKNVARIRRASVRKLIKEPKTDAGQRDVTLLPGAIEALDAQKPFSFLAGGRVFLNPRTGKPWETDAQIRRTAWQPAMKRAGIRYRTPYETRHTFASLCLTAGEEIAWVSRQLGHKSIAMTLKRYARYIDGVVHTGGQKFAALLTQSGHRSAASG